MEEEESSEEEDEPSLASTRIPSPSPSLSQISRNDNNSEFTNYLYASEDLSMEPANMVPRNIPNWQAVKTRSEVDLDEEQSDHSQDLDGSSFELPPSIESARLALAGIKLVLNPP
jgi:hypothetical protein